MHIERYSFNKGGAAIQKQCVNTHRFLLLKKNGLGSLLLLLLFCKGARQKKSSSCTLPGDEDEA